MESDSSDAECLPDLESWDHFLVSSFDAEIIVDDEDEVEGSENADSLGLENYCFWAMRGGCRAWGFGIRVEHRNNNTFIMLHC